jgi:hypothetical protein
MLFATALPQYRCCRRKGAVCNTERNRAGLRVTGVNIHIYKCTYGIAGMGVRNRRLASGIEKFQLTG